MSSIFTIHNRYQQAGGEDRVFDSEAELLESRGHRVVRYTDHNDRISQGFVTGLAAIWNQGSFRRVRRVARKEGFDVAHFHNTFPLISPSAYYALRRERVPIVQTLHNFRLICPGGILLRQGKPCEECIENKSLRPALTHGCYRDSRLATAAVCGMLTAHRVTGTWGNAVNTYIASSNFARAKFVEAGLPGDRIVVKTNAIGSDPGIGAGDGAYALFVGRISEEKGIPILAQAWRHLEGIPLLVAGDGPLNGIEWPEGVRWLGYPSRESVIGLMKNATFLVFPSICYESAPMTILEALACGLPVIASDIGSIPELVMDHHNGLLFRAGDAEDLAAKVRWMVGNPERVGEMRVAARREYETKYTAEINYKRLIEIYEIAIESAHRA